MATEGEDSARPAGRPISTRSPLRVRVMSSAKVSMARPWAEGKRAICTNSRRDGRPLAGPSAVATTRVSPTTASGTRTMRVTPEMAAVRAAGPPASSRRTRTRVGWPWAPGPSATVQVEPSFMAKRGVSEGLAIRTAE